MRKLTKSCLTIALLLTSGALFAADDLASISEHAIEQVRTVANLLVIVAYVAGVGFALAGVVQFKAHKDNPAQVPLSKPLVYLIVGACLLFLPAIMKSAGGTIFKDTGDSGAGADVSQGL